MITTLTTHLPLSRLSRHSVSYSNLPHSHSLSFATQRWHYVPGSGEDTKQAAKETENSLFKGATLRVLPYVLGGNCQWQSVTKTSCFNLQTKGFLGD